VLVNCVWTTFDGMNVAFFMLKGLWMMTSQSGAS